MTSPIDPARRAAMLRRAQKHDADAVDEAQEAQGSNLPTVIEPVVRPSPRAPAGQGGATFAAQLLGQDGQKRGLRGGATVIDTARASYNRIEYSGSHDRRARKGKVTKTDI
jgi:hypothetical protein